nr:hypothetical protein [Pseudonocardia sp. Ae168_Ps1]
MVRSAAASHTTEQGTSVPAIAPARSSARSVAWSPTTMVSSTIRASTEGSAQTIEQTSPNARSSRLNSWAVTSTGLASAPNSGTTRASFARVSGASPGSSRAVLSHRSAARIPAPPDVVTAAILRPRGLGPPRSAVAAASSSSTSSTRTTPCRCETSRNAVSSPSIAPVCDTAARRPDSDRPDRSTTRAVPLAAASAASRA